MVVTVSTELLIITSEVPSKIKERCIKLKQRLFVDEEDVDRIGKETVGQSANENCLFISTVNFNPEFWSSVLPKLEAFYNEHILVELHYGITPMETRLPKKVGYPRCFVCPYRFTAIFKGVPLSRFETMEAISIVIKCKNVLIFDQC